MRRDSYFPILMPRSAEPRTESIQRELFRVGPDGRVKTRTIYEPSEEVEATHAETLRRLYGFGVPMPHAMGGLPGKSLIDNVRPHRHNNDFYMLDISGAYESVEIDYLTQIAHDSLYKLHVPRSEIKEFTDFIQTDAIIDGVPGVPMGYPASPYLFNLYCKPMDDALAAGFRLRSQFGGKVIDYTRWLDDFTFSSTETFSKDDRRWIRERILETPGFEIAHHKSRHNSIKKGPVTITGLSIYPDRRIQPTDDLIDKIAKTFRELQYILDQGIPLTDEEIGILHGYNGVLHLGGDPRASGSSVLVRLSDVHDRLTDRASELAV